MNSVKSKLAQNLLFITMTSFAVTLLTVICSAINSVAFFLLLYFGVPLFVGFGAAKLDKIFVKFSTYESIFYTLIILFLSLIAIAHTVSIGAYTAAAITMYSPITIFVTLVGIVIGSSQTNEFE